MGRIPTLIGGGLFLLDPESMLTQKSKVSKV